MSHIVTVQTQIRDPISLRAACQRFQLEPPAYRTVKLFSSEATGYCVQLPDWRYPVVCDTQSGHVHYDNYDGQWGEQRHLDRLNQCYAVERSKLEARRQGHGVTERPLDDGSIQLTIHVGETR